MQIQIQNSMGSKNKVRSMLGKFEDRSGIKQNKTKTKCNELSTVSSSEEQFISLPSVVEDILTVPGIKQLFESHSNSTKPMDSKINEKKKTPNRSASPTRSYLPVPTKSDKHLEGKPSKLRRNQPVSSRKPPVSSSILVKASTENSVVIPQKEDREPSEITVTRKETCREMAEKIVKKVEKFKLERTVLTPRELENLDIIEREYQANMNRNNNLSTSPVQISRPLNLNKKNRSSNVAFMIGSLEEKSKNPSLPGAPPAKPPRTFAHDAYVIQKAVKVATEEHIYDTVDGIKLHDAKYVKNSSGDNVDSPTGVLLKNSNSTIILSGKLTSNKLLLEPYAITDIYKDAKERSDGFQLVPKRKSRFYIENEPESNEGKLVRCFSDEHVYDEPLTENLSLKSYNSDETLILNNVMYDRINCKDGKKENDLHYSSTPILSPRRTFSSRTKSVPNWSKSFKKNTPKKHKTVREIVSRSFSSVRRRQFSDESGANVRRSSSEDDSGDSDNEISANELEKRIIYMRTVSRASSIKVDRSRLSDPTVPRLFDSVLVINLRYSESNVGYDPYVKLSYPKEYCGSDPRACPALHFCFPDSEFWKPSATGEDYTFVLTNQKGERTYGYCRRIKPDDAPVSLPVVYCILSPVLSFKFYSRILYELECRHGLPDAEIKSFLDSLHHCRMPRPGFSIRMSIYHSDTKEEIQRPIDSTTDDIGVEYLLKALDVNILVKVFASLLLERRIVLYSANLTLLSRCVHSFVAFLHPFVWQHTFIPVLPSVAIEVIGSPTPFIVGVLSHYVSQLRDLPLDLGHPVLMVDLDHNRLFHETGDENKVIPKKIQKGLMLALKMAKNGPESSLMAVEAFIRLFVETVGHYDNFVVVQQDGKKIFERDSFCTAIESHSITTFLQWFTETQMFNSFIDTLTDDNPVSYACFDKRIQEFRDEFNSTQTLGKNFRDLGKKVKTLGERLIGFKTPDKSKANPT